VTLVATLRKAQTKGAKLNIYSVVVPEAWDVTSTYEFVDAVGSVYFGKASSAWRPVLAFRLGGKKVWGTFPYFHSAFIGGKETVRGFDKGRFAGDASAYGGSDLRFLLFKPKILSVSHFGLFGFADAGRVWVDGDSPGDLHTGYGGGIWLSFIGLPNTTSIAIAKSDERTAFYLWWGFPL
jgi:outer membrane protein assembly factor BamA